MNDEKILKEIEKRTQELMDEYDDMCSSRYKADCRRDECRRKAILEALNKVRQQAFTEIKKGD